MLRSSKLHDSMYVQICNIPISFRFKHKNSNHKERQYETEKLIFLELNVFLCNYTVKLHHVLTKERASV